MPPIVFVGGLHRSGTSLVHGILRDHPDASGFRNTGVPEDEGQHLQTVIPTAMAHGGVGRFGFDPASCLDETSPLCTAANAEAIWSAWRRHWDTSRAVLVEKSPPNLVRARLLQALFPDSSFDMVIRHPVAVSMATLKWRPHDPISLIKHWIACHRRFEADRPHVRRPCVVRYEELVERPSAVVPELYRFAGLRPFAIETAVQDDINDRYFREWRALLDSRPEAALAFANIYEEYAAACARYDYPAAV